MAVVETERHGQVLVVRMNRPERLNALSHEMRSELAEAWTEFRHSKELEVAIFTGTGRGFCAGEDMKESLQRGAPGSQRPDLEDPFMTGALEKPVIAAVNGFAMGGGFMLVERTDLRVAVREAVFEVSEAKRWLLGGYNHGHIANLPYPDRHGDGAGLPLHRRALLRGGLPQPPGRRRRPDAGVRSRWPSTCSPCRRPRGSTPCT